MIAGGLAANPRILTAAGIICASGAAWLALLALHSGTTGASWGELCLSLAAPYPAAAPTIFSMWLLMCVAMMLPTAAPALDVFARLAKRAEAATGLLVGLFAGGYIAAWGVFGAVAAGLQIALAQAASLPDDWAAAGLLLLAGGYQFSRMKATCLTLCRNPLAFFMSQWREGAGGAFAMGLRHGAVCVGCCWALMALMFLAGAMNPLWMALLGLAMAAEKALPGADTAGRLAGASMILAAAGLAATAIV